MSGKKADETVSKLGKITAESTVIEVAGEEFEIHPLTNKEFLQHVTSQEAQKGDQSEIVLDLVTTVLQKDDERITREEVEMAPPELVGKVMKALEEVNGLQDFIEMSGETKSL